MRLVDLAEGHGQFYVPAFVVRVGREDLVRDLAVAVSQVEIDLNLTGAGRFSFTLVDCYDFEQRTFLSGHGRELLDIVAFGAEVEIGLGYGDVGGLTTMISGVITEIGTTFSESGSPELAVAGYDRTFPLTLGKHTRSWKEVRDSDVVSEIAAQHNLRPDVQTTEEKHAQIEQNQENDYEFIKKLAKRNHFEHYVVDKTLFFRKPHDKGDGVVTLAWGEGLLSFKPEANLATQVARVEVCGWDHNQKTAIVGIARAGDEAGRDPSRDSAGDLLNKVMRKPGVLRVRQPVFTQAEADKRAKALLSEHSKEFLTGDGECIGLPDLRPDRNINLEKLGVPFSKTYYLLQTTHKVDGNGYRTRFKVKESTLWRP